MITFSEDEIVLISAVEHYSYCPRQCALIHVEKVFDENVYTLRGTIAHKRVDEPVETAEHDVKVERALPIWSDVHGLQGKADVVEFHQDGSVYPVEYKIGGRRASEHDDLQLCAQALCLEEMLGLPILFGAIYSGSAHKRREVELTQSLRDRTLEVVSETRSMLKAGSLPEPVNDSRCPNCSLILVCMPSVVTTWSEVDLFHPTDEEASE